MLKVQARNVPWYKSAGLEVWQDHVVVDFGNVQSSNLSVNITDLYKALETAESIRTQGFVLYPGRYKKVQKKFLWWTYWIKEEMVDIYLTLPINNSNLLVVSKKELLSVLERTLK